MIKMKREEYLKYLAFITICTISIGLLFSFSLVNSYFIGIETQPKMLEKTQSFITSPHQANPNNLEVKEQLTIITMDKDLEGIK